MRLRLTVLGLLVFVVGGGVTIWWFFAASFGERQLQQLQTNLAKDGYALRYGKIERSGFPNRLEWLVHDVSIVEQVSSSDQSRLHAEADKIRFSSLPWKPQRLDFRVEGDHRWLVPSHGAAGPVLVDIASADGRFGPRDEQAGWEYRMNLGGLQASPQSDAEQQLTVETVVATAVWPTDFSAVQTQVALANVVLPRDIGLGASAERIEWSAGIRPVPSDYSEIGLTNWRDRGGVLNVEDMRVVFGPLDGQAYGSVGLDEMLRPAGNIALRLREPKSLVEAASQAGALDAQMLQLAQLAIAFVSRRGEDGQTQAQLAFVMRDGKLILSGFPIADLQPLPY